MKRTTERFLTTLTGGRLQTLDLAAPLLGAEGSGAWGEYLREEVWAAVPAIPPTVTPTSSAAA